MSERKAEGTVIVMLLILVATTIMLIIPIHEIVNTDQNFPATLSKDREWR